MLRQHDDAVVGASDHEGVEQVFDGDGLARLDAEAAAAERKRLKQIENSESEIERLEAELAELNERMTLPEISSDYGKIMELTKQAAEMQEKIDGLYALLDELYN